MSWSRTLSAIRSNKAAIARNSMACSQSDIPSANWRYLAARWAKYSGLDIVRPREGATRNWPIRLVAAGILLIVIKHERTVRRPRASYAPRLLSTAHRNRARTTGTDQSKHGGIGNVRCGWKAVRRPQTTQPPKDENGCTLAAALMGEVSADY